MPAFLLSTLYVGFMLLTISDLFPAIAQLSITPFLGIGAMLAIVVYQRQEWPIWRHQVFVLLLFFIAAIGTSMVANGWVGGGALAVWQYLPYSLVLIFVGSTGTTTSRLAWLRNVLVIIAVAFTCAGLYDLFTGVTESHFILGPKHSDDVQEEPVEVDPGVLRLKALGTSDDPNDFAQFLLIAIALIRARRFEKEGWLLRAIRALVIVFLMVGLFYTRSRGAFVGLSVLLALAAWERFRWVGAAAVIAMAAAAAPFVSTLSGRDLSLEGGADRLAIWSDALGAIKHSPLLGNGFGSATDLLELTAHNSYLLCLVELGLAGFLCWIGMLLVVAIPLWRLAEAPPGTEAGITIRSWARAIRSAIIAFLVTSFFLSRTYHFLFLLLLGMAFAVVQINSDRIGEKEERLPMKTWVPIAAAMSIMAVGIPYGMIRLEHFLR